ncbi:MAG: DUF6049 family protein [Acidimicrobiia bacterium]
MLLTVTGPPATGARSRSTNRASAAPGAPDPSITLTGQPAWTELGGDIAFRLAVTNATAPNLQVRAIFYSATLSRIAFERSLDGEGLGRDLVVRSIAVGAMPVVGTDRTFSIGLQDPRLASDPLRVRLPMSSAAHAGVFPVKLQLRDPDSGQVFDDVVTPVVAVRPAVAGETPSEPLQVASLWNIASSPNPPTVNPGPNPALATEVGPKGRLGRLATALGDVRDVAVTVVPNPATVDAIRSQAVADPRAAAVLTAIRNVSQSALTLSGPYATVDGPSLLRSRLTDAFDASLSTGRTVLESTLEVAIDPTIAPVQPLDERTLAALRSRSGVTRLVVEPGALAPADAPDQFTPARPFRIDSAAGSFDALQVNAIASDLLTRRGPDALRAQQLLASLAVIALEQPNRTRGVLINTPLLWDVLPNRVNAVLAGLRSHPLLRSAPATDLFRIPAETLKGKPYVRTLAPISPPGSPITAGSYARTSRSIDAMGSMIGAARPIVSQLRAQLQLTIAGRVPGTGASVSDARVRVIDDAVRSATSVVTTRASRSVTLTSRRAAVPLSLENASARPVRVRVTLASQKLDFPKGSEKDVPLPPGNTTIQFEVEARASGTFPVLVSVGSPDGGLNLQRARYTVRSSGVSGVGLVLTIGAGLFLAAWWLTHWRRSRRRPTPALT